MLRWRRRNKSKPDVSLQYLDSRIKRLEQQMNALQKWVEDSEHEARPPSNLKVRLDKLEYRIMKLEAEASINQPDNSGKRGEHGYDLPSEENRNLRTPLPTSKMSRSSVDQLDDSKIDAAISVYRQQSTSSGELFVPLSKYFAELEKRRISVDELESRIILDTVASKYPGAVRIEQVRGKPDKQIAILDEYIDHRLRQ